MHSKKLIESFIVEHALDLFHVGFSNFKRSKEPAECEAVCSVHEDARVDQPVKLEPESFSWNLAEKKKARVKI